MTSTEKQLIIEDGKDVYLIIKILGPDEPNIGLGFCLCPSGNQEHQREAICEAIKEMCQSVAGAYLTKHEARRVLS